MIINYNSMASNALRQLNINSGQQAKSMAKLSSGLRINSASDDAAGLAISEKMKGQIRGLDQASRNAQDGQSMIQTAEGALSQTTDILQRMRELAVQSSNDTNTDQDRTNIQSEMGQLEKEVDRIGTTTQFNTKNLLDGSMGKSVSQAVANVNTSVAFKDAVASTAASSSTLLTSLGDSNGNSLGISVGDKITVNFTVNGTAKSDSITVTSTTTLAGLAAAGSNLNTAGTLAVTSTGTMTETANTAGSAGAIEGLTISVQDSSGNTRAAASNNLSSFTETTGSADKRTDGSATLLIGANGGQTLSVDINDMRASALGVSGLSVSTQSQANTAIKVLDTAIQKVSAERAKLGAFENRLDNTINNLNTSSQNISDAQSRVADVDMAKEMMNQSKSSVLAQAAQAMLAQANQQPQQVLQLLRG
ncbi:flagellin [Bacillus sp. BRMEA1]|uniref:flagellin N-terminal helical domain-containing protein n=1 Tax=Neobacillus endophyticus TaxID=2738405 RepID=UPI0015672BC1|nr:flagellin [Neobacillus endophyticus]NRD79380.1 flagellin [Neobacillus endophyticus]